MTCNCIEKVVAAINAVSDDYTFEAGTGLRSALNRIVAELTSAARLSPPPAKEAAAPRPGESEPARGPCTCNRNYVDDDEHAPDCGTQKPAPSSTFDANAWAEKLFCVNTATRPYSLGVVDRGGVWSESLTAEAAERVHGYFVDATAAALTAAHAAGRAEGDAAGYARGKDEAEAHIEVIDGERKALAKIVSAVVEATRPVHEQLGASAPPAADQEAK